MVSPGMRNSELLRAHFGKARSSLEAETRMAELEPFWEIRAIDAEIRMSVETFGGGVQDRQQ